MRHYLHSLPLLLLAMTLPMLARQSTPPRNTTQTYRTGEGAPRKRNPAATQTFEERTLSAADGATRTRPYKVPKPGEGAPKG